MSRTGNKSITIEKGVDVKIDNHVVMVKGPKGSLKQEILFDIDVFAKDGLLFVKTTSDKEMRKYQGLYRSLINNMLIGVTKGFEKKLQMIGVGFRATVKDRILDLQIGFSHEVFMDIPNGIDVKVDNNTFITVYGIDKQSVGEFAAEIRAKRPPEPYKGKGIRYKDEYVRRKAGKSGR